MTAWVKQLFCISVGAFALTSGLSPAIALASETANSPEAMAFASPSMNLPEIPPLGEPSLYLPNSETHLVLRLGERRVYVYRGDEVLASYPVAIGTSQTPTPTGEFQVFQMVEDPVWQSPWTGEIKEPGPNSALGLRWIGFAEMSNGIIGFHGTPTVSSIGYAASNGCVRMHNKDVVAMFEQIQMGAKVIVER